jgi:hypothetical protein
MDRTVSPPLHAARIVACLALLVPLTMTGCSKSSKTKKKVLSVDDDTAIRPVGVPAHSFSCETVAPTDMVAGAVGTKVKAETSPFTPPAGAAAPCVYVGAIPDAGMVSWSFDIDCRERAQKDAKQLMVQYAQSEGALPVRIGQSGLDHNDASLLFIDDDSPCYVRVLGPGQQNRIGIAELVARKLDESTAPMSTVYRRETVHSTPPEPPGDEAAPAPSAKPTQ